ncbi:MAG: asparagine--tRNA ligase [Flavobacteriaceae bacterium]|jgi:asparaginyl-tRNA synthetase|nr:asparagine--tRNA ligase [Flavobacteriaceae bacterium]MBT6169572.1 asparagine--tRNA ligase [Flavobacteriaceae bacterium]MBT6447366.1 asparagine--tRNA ligase [Flavobacteriaceae bacterium]
MNNFTVKSLLKEGPNSQKVFIEGWVKTFRANRFISLNDGSCSESIQCVVDFQNTNSKILSKINTGTSVKIEGLLVESQGKGQKSEIKVGKITILGECDMDSYPIQPKKHSLQFLRENAHLRVRTNTFSSIMRVRSNLSFAIHKYFKEKGFFYVNTPIITGSDAEGAGEMFKVTTLEINKDSLNQKNEVNYDEDFFGKETNLTVSGQLEAESLAMGLGKVYTFGPTFRAENSNTSRHLAEFWMIEPEMAFYDLEDNMELAEDFIKYIIKDLINECKEDLEFLNQRLIDEDKSKPINERNELSLLDRLDFVIKNNFKRITYSEAFEILKNSKPNKKKKFKFPILEWGVDFQSEHERYLVEKHFKKPVIIYNYPAKIKAFYMRLNEDKKTVKAMDILFPGIGEIVGGSQREERLDVLKSRIQELNIEEKELWWYLDLRKYGTVKHSGFGLGLERLILFATGMSNIRDVIPFPRTPKSAEF